MDESARTSFSKFLSLVLRHKPETIGIELDKEGWVDVRKLIEACRAHGRKISPAMLEEIVTTSPKQRFALSSDRARIRAHQGHSIEVELGYEQRPPPDRLFHGTPERFVPAIRRSGLQKMARHHVHLSADEATAADVGRRRGTPKILIIDSARMAANGFAFFCSANGVWLVDAVPPEYIVFPD